MNPTYVFSLHCALLLMAMGVGLALVTWTKQKTSKQLALVTFGGYFIAAAALLCLISISYVALNSTWASPHEQLRTIRPQHMQGPMKDKMKDNKHNHDRSSQNKRKQ